MEKKAKTPKTRRLAKQVAENFSVRDRIKPRGLLGWMKGKIHYDETEDIFNLSL